MLTEANHVPGVEIRIVGEVLCKLLLCLQTDLVCREPDRREGRADRARGAVDSGVELARGVCDIRDGKVLELHEGRRQYTEG